MPARVPLAFFILLSTVSCAPQPQAAPRAPANPRPTEAATPAPAPAASPVVVMVPDGLRSILTDDDLAGAAGGPVRVITDPATPATDPGDGLVARLNAGEPADLWIAEDARQLSALTRPALMTAPWLVNRVVLIAPRGSRLRLIDLSKGACQIAVVLERGAAGRAAVDALTRRGLLPSVSDRLGLFDTPLAVIEHVRASRPACLGVVLATDPLGSGVSAVATLDTDRPIVHTLVALTPAGERAARALLDAAAPTAQRHNLSVPSPSAPPP